MRGSLAARPGRRPDDLAEALARLSGLPLRPLTAWAILREHAPEAAGLAEALPEPASDPRGDDPGWHEGRARRDAPAGELELVATRCWWRTEGEAPRPALVQLARHAAAIAWTAGQPSPAGDAPRREVRRIGLLAPLGAWSLAAVDLDALAEWLALANRERRRRWELDRLGATIGEVGRAAAQRWHLGARIEAAAWAFDEPDAEADRIARACGLADDPDLAACRRARATVAASPLALFPDDRCGPSLDPTALRPWMAAFQAARPSPFLAAAGTLRDEALVRALAGRLAEEQPRRAIAAARARLVAGLRESRPGEGRAAWLGRLRALLVGLPGVAAVVLEPAGPSPRNAAAPTRPADLERSLPPDDAPVVVARIWLHEATGREPRAALDMVLEACSCWASWFREVETLRTLARPAGAAAGLDAGGLPTPAVLLDALAQFAAGAGHELNNPLAVVMGRAQLLLGRAEDADVRRALRVIISQAQRAHRMLRDLMFVAQPSPPRLRPFVPEEIARRCLEDLREEAEARGVTIRLDVAPAPRPTLEGDPDQLRHLIDALVRNALEASPRGATVDVRLRRRDPGLVVEVRDRGHGLRADEGHRLLNPFYCGRQAGRGLGLGLPRVARAVEQAGGSLRWSSPTDGGARFVVRLPATETPPAPGASA